MLDERLFSPPSPSTPGPETSDTNGTTSVSSPKSPGAPTAPVYRSVYREILFLTLVSLNQENIDLTAFDREYSRAFDDLPDKYKAVVQKSDYPPDRQVALCRKIFRELRI